MRIEPGDVENHMVRIHGVTGCGVVERYGHLVAYVTVSHEMTPGQIRAAARPHLPTHMIPGIVRHRGFAPDDRERQTGSRSVGVTRKNAGDSYRRLFALCK